MKLTQRDKWFVEGVIPVQHAGSFSTSYEVVSNVVVAPSREAAMEMVFDKRVQENEGYVVQGAVPLLDLIRTLRKIYDQPVDDTNYSFHNNLQS